MAVVEQEIVTLSSNKAPVWRHFGYMKDSATGKAMVGKKVTWRSRTLAELPIARIFCVPTNSLSIEICTVMSLVVPQLLRFQLDVFCNASCLVQNLP